MRWFLDLAYDGTHFHGWQSQPNALGVQAVLEEALSVIFRDKTPVTGAGRTDAGVHARRMYAHFDTVEPIVDKDKILLSLNRMAGKDIVIRDILAVRADAHARFDALSRTYRYYVTSEKNPFASSYSWECRRALDVSRMNEAACMLLDVDDFTSFAKLHSDTRTNICNVSHAEWKYMESEGPGAGRSEMRVFTISADRFLRNMVRAVVGTLVEVGTGRMSLSQFREVIEKRDRCAAGTSMPAKALFLEEIVYPEAIFI